MSSRYICQCVFVYFTAVLQFIYTDNLLDQVNIIAGQFCTNPIVLMYCEYLDSLIFYFIPDFVESLIDSRTVSSFHIYTPKLRCI